MKKHALFLSLTFVLAVSVLTSNFAYAQEPECRDAAGAVIPCPPTEEPSTAGGGGGSNPNQPSVMTATPSPTLTPVPTNTPLPISDKPTENPTKNAPSEVTPTPTAEPVITSSDKDGATEGENDWEDVCTFDLCLGLTVACYLDGGTPGIVEDGSGNTGVHCTIPDADDGAAAPFPWGPVGIVGLIIILIALLLPAVQKVRAKQRKNDSDHKNWTDIQSIANPDNSQPAAKDRQPVPENSIGKEDIIKREDKDKG